MLPSWISIWCEKDQFSHIKWFFRFPLKPFWKCKIKPCKFKATYTPGWNLFRCRPVLARFLFFSHQAWAPPRTVEYFWHMTLIMNFGTSPLSQCWDMLLNWCYWCFPPAGGSHLLQGDCVPGAHWLVLLRGWEKSLVFFSVSSKYSVWLLVSVYFCLYVYTCFRFNEISSWLWWLIQLFCLARVKTLLLLTLMSSLSKVAAVSGHQALLQFSFLEI